MIDFEPDAGSNKIRQFSRLLDPFQDAPDIPGQFSAEIEYFFRLFPDISHQRFGLDIDFPNQFLIDRLHGNTVKGALSHIANDFCLHNTLNECLDSTIGQFQQTENARNGADFIDLVGFRVFDAGIFLGGQK